MDRGSVCVCIKGLFGIEFYGVEMEQDYEIVLEKLSFLIFKGSFYVIVICMQKNGEGIKIFKNWLNGILLEEVVKVLNEQRGFKMFQLVMLVGEDVFVWFEMRLCY